MATNIQSFLKDEQIHKEIAKNLVELEQFPKGDKKFAENVVRVVLEETAVSCEVHEIESLESLWEECEKLAGYAISLELWGEDWYAIYIDKKLDKAFSAEGKTKREALENLRKKLKGEK